MRTKVTVMKTKWGIVTTIILFIMIFALRVLFYLVFFKLLAITKYNKNHNILKMTALFRTVICDLS